MADYQIAIFSMVWHSKYKYLQYDVFPLEQWEENKPYHEETWVLLILWCMYGQHYIFSNLRYYLHENTMYRAKMILVEQK